MGTDRQYTNLADFYPFYLDEQANRISRRLHFLGANLASALVVLALGSQRWWLLLLAPLQGKFGQGKRRFGLGLVREKLAETSGCTIAMNLLVMNLEKILELLFALIAIFQGSLMACIASESRSTPLIPSGLSLATC